LSLWLHKLNNPQTETLGLQFHSTRKKARKRRKNPSAD
jgi:hypothetical protein